MGQKWPDCDPKIKELIDNTVQVFKDVIPEKLGAVFLHGSLAMGSFYPPKSDIDLLILAKNILNIDEQKHVHNSLIGLTDSRPITGFLELSVVLSDIAKQPRHPIPYELHYGEGFPEKIRSGAFDYNKVTGNDSDLAAHFTVTKNRGISLHGPARSKNGLKAVEKRKIQARKKLTVWLTANRRVYDPTKTYFFFDSTGITKEVRTNQGLKADPEKGCLDSLGYRVVSISKLHISEAEAEQDAIEFHRGIISAAEKEISKLNKSTVCNENNEKEANIRN